MWIRDPRCESFPVIYILLNSAKKIVAPPPVPSEKMAELRRQPPPGSVRVSIPCWRLRVCSVGISIGQRLFDLAYVSLIVDLARHIT